MTRDEYILTTAREIAARIAGDAVTLIDSPQARENIAAWSVDLAERVWVHARIPIEAREEAA